MLRKILSLVAAVAAGFVVVAAVQAISTRIYPLPDGVNPADPEALKDHIASLPFLAFVLVLVADALGALVAGFVCAAINRNSWSLGPVLVGLVLLSAGIVNLIWIPHPMWFSMLDVLLYVPAAWAGGQLSGRVFGPHNPTGAVP